MECIKLRAAVIRTILDTKAAFAPTLPINEGLLDPSSLRQYPLKSIKRCEVPFYTLNMVSKSIIEKYTSAFDRSHRHTIRVSKLLHWDPYMNLGRDVLEDIFNPVLQNVVITTDFVDKFCERVESWEKLAQHVFQLDRSTVGNISLTSNNLASRACKYMFHTVQGMEMLTFGRLRELFDSFSIFNGRDLIVS